MILNSPHLYYIKYFFCLIVYKFVYEYILLDFGQNLAAGHPPDLHRHSLAQGMAAAKFCPNEHLPSIRELFGGLSEIRIITQVASRHYALNLPRANLKHSAD